MRSPSVALLLFFFPPMIGCERKTEPPCPPAATAAAPSATVATYHPQNFRWEVSDPNARDAPVVLVANADTPVAGGKGWTCTGRVSNTSSDEGRITQSAAITCTSGDEVVSTNLQQREDRSLVPSVPLGITKSGRSVLTLLLAARPL
jgi:hypothetical protein